MPGKKKKPQPENLFPVPRWLSKEQAMEVMQIKPGLLYKFINEYGLKVSKVSSIMRFLESDIHDFWMRYRS